jgi:hypothetical protein
LGTSEENEMTIPTDRATVEESAAAWDYLMSTTETGSDAITKAWCWLRDQVEAREAATRVACDQAPAVETENAVQLRVVEVDDREVGYVPEEDPRS